MYKMYRNLETALCITANSWETVKPKKSKKCYLKVHEFKTFGLHTHFVICVELPDFLKGFKGDVYCVLVTVYS